MSSSGVAFVRDMKRYFVDVSSFIVSVKRGAGIACWLERRTRDSKGCEFESRKERRENFLLQS